MYVLIILLLSSWGAICSASVVYNEDLGQATIKFGQEVNPLMTAHTLQLGFNYNLSDGLSGFYQSVYTGGSTPIYCFLEIFHLTRVLVCVT